MKHLSRCCTARDAQQSLSFKIRGWHPETKTAGIWVNNQVQISLADTVGVPDQWGREQQGRRLGGVWEPGTISATFL